MKRFLLLLLLNPANALASDECFTWDDIQDQNADMMHDIVLCADIKSDVKRLQCYEKALSDLGYLDLEKRAAKQK